MREGRPSLLDELVPFLERTPEILRAWLGGLSDAWTTLDEGPGTWSPKQVVAHLVIGERTDWIPRAEHLLRHGESVPFPVFDREAMFSASEGLSTHHAGIQ